MRETRRYILENKTIMSCGIGTCVMNDGIVQNLLNSFSVTYDTTPPTVCSYSQITTEDLKILSKIDYSCRVSDFLNYVSIEDNIAKENLINESIDGELECDNLFCQLNPNFIIYKFLSGIRIVDVGDSYGVVQYKIYPQGESEDDYDWQTNATFLNLNQNGIYYIIIRDFFNGEEICRYSKLISMPLILASTTTTLVSKTVSLKEISVVDCCSPIFYKTGCLNISPALSVGECVGVNFMANALTCGNYGYSCVKIKCTPYQETVSQDYFSITNEDVSPVCGEMKINYGDLITYEAYAACGDYGSRNEGSFYVVDANGCGTINPTIDMTRCKSCVIACTYPVYLTVSMGNKTTTSSSTSLITCGTFTTSTPIPCGHYVDLSLCGIEPALNGGTSKTEIYCRSKYCSTFVLLDSLTNNFCWENVSARMCDGDSICYKTSLTAPFGGSEASSVLCLASLSGSIGVTPTKVPALSGSCVSTCLINPPTPTVISVCGQNGGSNWEGGFIGINPTLATNAIVDVCLSVKQDSIWGGTSLFCLSCVPNCGGSYLPLCTIQTTTQVGEIKSSTKTGVVKMRYGDSIYYCNCATGNNNSCSDFCVIGVSGNTYVAPTISTTKFRNCETSVYNTPVNTTIGLVGQNGGTGWNAGYVSVSPAFTRLNQGAVICFTVIQNLIGSSGFSRFAICRSVGGTGIYDIICQVSATPTAPLTNLDGSFRILCGDTITWKNETTGLAGSCSQIELFQACGSPDINATISATQHKSCVKI